MDVIIICRIDNLFISAKFCHAAKSEIPQKVMIHGVCWTHDHGLPELVIKQEVKTESKIERARGTVKAVVLKGNERVTDLVAFSIYGTKPVYFLSTEAASLKWVTENKKCGM